MPYGLLFDVDGVIADTEGPGALAAVDMFRDLHGIEVTVEDFQPFIGTGPLRYVGGVAEKYGLEIDIDEGVQGRHERFVERVKREGMPIFDGVHELIAAGGESPDWKMALATSSARVKCEFALEMGHVDLNAFDAWITGDDVTHRKPHPEIYLTAAKAIDVAPERCVVVEDAITGIEAAKAAGMKCVAVSNSFSKGELRHADLVVESLDTVDLAALRKILQ